MRTSTSFGFARDSSSQPRFQRSSAPGRKFSIMMCVPRARRRTISCPSGWRRSQVTDFLLRDCTCHQSEVPLRMRRHLRSGSPSPGGSILITSAPKSASVFAQNGPAISEPNSRTRTPASGPPLESGSEPDFIRSFQLNYVRRTDLFALEEAKRVVLQHRLAALVQHLVREPHQAAVALRREAVLDHFRLDVDGVADEGGPFDVERRVEEREPGVLHGRQQQAFGERIDERAGYGAALDAALRIVLYGEELLGEPGQVDEGGEVGLGDRAAVGAETKADAQILERESA